MGVCRGKAESGESFEKGLLREIAEETGLFVCVGRVPGATESESPTARVVYLVFEGRVLSGETQLNSEHDEYARVEPQDLTVVGLADQSQDFVHCYIEAKGRL